MFKSKEIYVLQRKEYIEVRNQMFLIFKFSTSVELESDNVCVSVCVSVCMPQNFGAVWRLQKLLDLAEIWHTFVLWVNIWGCYNNSWKNTEVKPSALYTFDYTPQPESNGVNCQYVPEYNDFTDN